MDSLVFFAIAIIVALALAVLLPRVVRRSTRIAADREGSHTAQAAIDAALDELGRTVLLDCTETAAREIVDLAAFAVPREVTILGDGGYGLRFLAEDDATARLVSTPEGTMLRVERVREYLGRPQTAGFWSELRARVISVATAHAVSAGDGPSGRFRSDARGEWLRTG